jgi:UDP-GlcNAc:undecaprenyl-phosphate GlcNAc-1-phosphate transferase
MPLEARLLTSLALALAVVYWATPMAIRVAARFDFYDKPIGYKGHAAPTPYLGGAAVVAGFLLAVVVLTADWDRTLPLVGGVTCLWVIGTIDDRRQVSPLARVAVELLLAGVLWQLGLGWELGAGAPVDLAVTAVWIVAVINAFNLFDNMDGAASSMAGVVSAGLAILGAVEGDAWLAVAGAALAGACLGFLPHNLFSSPARIFLGDGGSMPVGFAVAALTMFGLTGSAPAWQSLGMGLLFVGIPALDTCLVIISRRRRGISILTGGRDHLTHRARSRLRTARAVAATLGSAQALVSVLAVIALQGGSAGIAVAVLLYVAGLGVAITLLDTRLAPEPVPAAVAVTAGGPAPQRRRSSLEVLTPALLVPFGLVAGLSPFAQGFYASRDWVPAGLVLIAVTTALAIARPVRLTGPARAVLAGLTGLAVWSLASSTWADSAQQAVLEANRQLVYAVALGFLLLLVRTRRAAEWLMAAVGAGALLVAVVVAARMLGGDGADVFLGGRLDRPLGYINGQASLFLLGFWACMAAAGRRSALAAGVGAAAATLLGCLLLLSQSRGVALATALSVVIVLALVPDRLRRAWSLVVIATGVALASPLLLKVYSSSGGATVDDAVVRRAGAAALLAALGAGVAWSLGSRPFEGRLQDGTRRYAAVALAVLACAAGLLGVARAGTITESLRTQYHAFVHLGVGAEAAGPQTGSRLVSGAGNRYDYWRVAWGAFRDKPVAGWGAGNYDGPYFERRATSEDVRQPHSVQLQALSELGLVGLALLLVVVAGAGWGVRRSARAARGDAGAAALTAGATGAAAAFLIHSSVDWIHLLPGVTAAALVAVAVLTRPPTGAPAAAPAARGTLPGRLAVAVAVALVLAVAGVSLMRQAMTDHFRANAEAALADDPAKALVEADRALRLDPDAVSVYYTKAAALARFNQPEAAAATLREAARREPHDFVTWALLGDLAVRVGDRKLAARYYDRAHRLNPREPSLVASAREPSTPAAP